MDQDVTCLNTHMAVLRKLRAPLREYSDVTGATGIDDCLQVSLFQFPFCRGHVVRDVQPISLATSVSYSTARNRGSFET
jgi:hypothetical protein